MKIADLKNNNKQELSILLQDNRKKEQDMRMSFATSKVNNIKELQEVRKDIAKILTLLNQK